MALRALIYILILTVGLFGATGLGPLLTGQHNDTLQQSVSVAAPLAQDDDDEDNGDDDDDNGGDNGGDDDDDDNGGDDDDDDNGGDDDDDDNGEDNGSSDDCEDNSSSDNGEDNGSSDNGEDNGSSDNGEDNGSSDECEDNGEDNGVVVSSATATPSGTRTPTPRPSPGSSPGPTGGPCWFVYGFAALHDLIPVIVGNCQSNEIHSSNGDGLQYTVGGLMVWRKADNWTAFTDGSITWLNGPCGLQTRPNEGPFYPWEGKVGSPCITLDPGSPEPEPLAFWP